MASPQGGVPGHYSGYSGYTPPPGAYNIHQHYQQPQHVDQRSSDSPLDFSAAASQYGNSSSAWNDEMRNYEDNKVIGFNDVNPSNGVDRASSPDYRSESSSTSPLQMTLLDGGGGRRYNRGHHPDQTPLP